MATILVGDQPVNPVTKIYDPATGVNDSGDVNASVVVNNPTNISIEGMAPTLTSVTVQTKVHKDGVWHDMLDVDITVANAFIIFTSKDSPNFVRVLRVGADDFIVYAQRTKGD